MKLLKPALSVRVGTAAWRLFTILSSSQTFEQAEGTKHYIN